MVRIAICDDSAKDVSSLKLLCESCSTSEILEISTFGSPAELLSAHYSNKYDILLLDIEMPEMNGIDLGKELRKTDTKSIIIFITAYPQYAIESYECAAFWYILKPCTKDKLNSVLNSAIEKLTSYNRSHTIKIRYKTLSLPLTNIHSIEFCKRHTVYHTSTGIYTTTERFADVYNALVKHGFYRVHQGYIVNFSKVKDFDNYTVILKNNEKVLISARKKREVLLAYARYVESSL